jgi:hypothetical protein
MHLKEKDVYFLKMEILDKFLKLSYDRKNLFFLPLSSYSFSGDRRGTQPTTEVTPKLLALFCACPTPLGQGIPHAQGFGNRT